MYLAENLKFLREQRGKTQQELAKLFGVEQKTLCFYVGRHIEIGETPEEAAIRETREEFGINIADIIPVTLVSGMSERAGFLSQPYLNMYHSKQHRSRSSRQQAQDITE